MDGLAVKNCRIRRSENQSEFATFLNDSLARKYTRHQISRWETNAERVPADVAQFLAVEIERMKPARKAKGKAKVIALSNFKGGVGKTTVSTNIADGLSRGGFKVLLIDCDPQATATCLLGLDAGTLHKQKKSLYYVLEGVTSITDAMQDVDGLKVISSHIAVVQCEIKAAMVMAGEKALQTAIKPVLNDFDFIILDAPPNPGKLIHMVFSAADRVLIPVRTEPLDQGGLELILEQIGEAQRALNPALRIIGIIPNHFDARKAVDVGLLAALKDQVGKRLRVFDAIPYDSAFGKAGVMDKPVVSYAPTSEGARAIMAVVREVENGNI